jgi:hypothetical protein
MYTFYHAECRDLPFLLQKFQKVWLQSLCRTFAGELMDSLYIAYEPPPPPPPAFLPHYSLAVLVMLLTSLLLFK